MVVCDHLEVPVISFLTITPNTPGILAADSLEETPSGSFYTQMKDHWDGGLVLKVRTI